MLTSVISKSVFGVGTLLGFGVIVFGLAGLGLALTNPKYQNDAGVAVGFVVLGNGLLGTCLVMLVKPHHTMGSVATERTAPRGTGGLRRGTGGGGWGSPARAFLGWVG